MRELQAKGCTCPYKRVPGGRLYEIMMRPHMGRWDTAEDCPIHEPPVNEQAGE